MSVSHGPITKAQAAVLRTVGSSFSIEPVNITPPKGDEVLIKISGVGVCHTDLVCRDSFPVPLPIILGHEGSGIVEAVGEDVVGLAPGDHVVLSFNSCGRCANCSDHHPASCLHMLPMNFGGAERVEGGQICDSNDEEVRGMFFGQSSFGSYAIARELNTVKVDSDLAIELLGPLGCGIQTGAGAVINSLQLRKGQSLIIFGCGAVGLSAVMAANALDAGSVLVVEPNEARRLLAIELGADRAIDPFTVEDLGAAIREMFPEGANYALDTTGQPNVIASAIDSIISGGVVGMVGMSKPDAMLPTSLLDLLSKNVTLKPITEGDANPKQFIPHLTQLFKQGEFPFDKLITTYPFEQINDAMKDAGSGKAIKPVIVF
ncbi:NAD(P)-dependent alcohol dehydrogenase [Marinobacter sp. NP-6]|uniref:NAD(P)-dependent alcohol dehydrogenase n=1 Tax=Marinobacter sp. NP-6 TaxID=2488666 RepID=UPI000FCC9A86|nr:NAD(P)-dependent alcohol dehydrogenase [Marinobacter sp. NP-6]RUT76931.1 NAD(P)-dependent alcohol dehydrogenase [Marinobacter sp. NP-6]